MAHYIALIRKEADSDFGVEFPDFPGCVTAGRTPDEALAMAREALALHIEVLAEDGAPLPSPSAIEAVMARRANKDAFATLVPALADEGPARRLNVTLPARLVEEIDRVAGKGKRSPFLAEAARQYLKDREPA